MENIRTVVAQQLNTRLRKILSVDKLISIAAVANGPHSPTFMNELVQYCQQPESAGIQDGRTPKYRNYKVILILVKNIFSRKF